MLASSGSAASTNINANAVSASTPDDDVKKVLISPQGGVEWDDFDEAVNVLRVKIESRVTDKDGNVLAGRTTAAPGALVFDRPPEEIPFRHFGSTRTNSRAGRRSAPPGRDDARVGRRTRPA